MNRRLITQREVQQKTGLSGPTTHRLRRKGKFPSPIKVGERRIAWFEDEIDAWLASRERSSLQSGSTA